MALKENHPLPLDEQLAIGELHPATFLRLFPVERAENQRLAEILNCDPKSIYYWKNAMTTAVPSRIIKRSLYKEYLLRQAQQREQEKEKAIQEKDQIINTLIKRISELTS